MFVAALRIGVAVCVKVFQGPDDDHDSNAT